MAQVHLALHIRFLYIYYVYVCVIITVTVHHVHTFTQELNLSYGELDPESALQVVEALSNKKEIQKIELNGQL